MEKVLEFEINALPRMTNPSGRRNHWAMRAAEARKWKGFVIAELNRLQCEVSLEKATLILTRFSSVSPDPDGLVSGFKHVIDGLVQGRVLKNDKIFNIGMPTYRWEKCSPKKGKIRVEVYRE